MSYMCLCVYEGVGGGAGVHGVCAVVLEGGGRGVGCQPGKHVSPAACMQHVQPTQLPDACPKPFVSQKILRNSLQEKGERAWMHFYFVGFFLSGIWCEFDGMLVAGGACAFGILHLD